jgi:hypothetical protein
MSAEGAGTKSAIASHGYKVKCTNVDKDFAGRLTSSFESWEDLKERLGDFQEQARGNSLKIPGFWTAAVHG